MAALSGRGPLVLGLTGSIGMGKSSVAAHFRRLGFPVHDSDAAVHELYSTGGAAAKAVSRELGADVLGPSGELDRGALWQRIQLDPTVLKRVEKIVHPLVAKHRDSWLEEHRQSFLCLLDVPLLFEAGGYESACDMILVASTVDLALQKCRVLAREGMTEAKLEQILAKQLPDEEKRQRADRVIVTSDPSMSPMRRQVAELIMELASKEPDRFRSTTLSPPQQSLQSLPVKCVALDLDDTIWDTKKWAAELPPPVDRAIERWLPNCFAAGIRYADPETRAGLEQVRAANRLLAHDHAEIRRRCYINLCRVYGDDPAGVDAVIDTYLEHRSISAFRHIYDDTLPFLRELKQRGVIIAAISDGNGDVFKSPALAEYFDFAVSAVSSGLPKPAAPQFLETLAKLQQRTTLAPVSAAEVLVIGDNLEKDIKGATAWGMRGCWIRRSGDFGPGRAICAEYGVPMVTTLDPAAVLANICTGPSL